MSVRPSARVRHRPLNRLGSRVRIRLRRSHLLRSRVHQPETPPVPPVAAVWDWRTGQAEIRSFTWREILTRMWPQLRRHRWKLLLNAAMVTLVGLTVAVVPLFSKYVIDVAIPHKSLSLAAGALGIYFLTQLVRILVWYRAMVFGYYMREDTIFHLRAQAFEHVQRLCLRFHNKFPSGYLYEQIFGRALGSIWTFFGSAFQAILLYSTGLAFSLFFCLRLSPVMTALILLGAGSYVAAGRRLSPAIKEQTQICIEAGNNVAQYISDKLRGNRTIQAFAMEDQVQQDFEARLWPVHEQYIEAERKAMRLSYVSEVISYVLNALTLLTGAGLVLNGQLPLGSLVAFISYQVTLVSFMQSLTTLYTQVATAQTGFNQFFSVLDTHSTVAEPAAPEPPPAQTADLEFRHVTFSYEQRVVVDDISFLVPPGQTVALVGRSGSGKTTIANLMLRFYDPDSGSILVGGQEVQHFPLRAYRALFGVVLQDPYLFNDTIAMNVRCAHPWASNEEVEAALHGANALDFVRQLPEGLNYRVGEGGSGLSGGQRQRIAIARCLLLQPQYLILDEATAALDNETEKSIQQALEKLFAGRTAFVIAHRLSTIKHANRILVVDRGHILEDGTFEELLEQEGLFHYLYKISTSGSTHALKLEEAGFA